MKRKNYRDRKQLFVSVEKDVLTEFQDLCDKEGKSVSLKLNEMLMDEIQKNPLGLPTRKNPINITFENDINQPGKKVSTISIPLDRFMEVSEAKSMANQIPLELTIPKVSGYAYHNSKKIMQQLQLRTEGKITV